MGITLHGGHNTYFWRDTPQEVFPGALGVMQKKYIYCVGLSENAKAKKTCAY